MKRGNNICLTFCLFKTETSQQKKQKVNSSSSITDMYEDTTFETPQANVTNTLVPTPSDITQPPPLITNLNIEHEGKQICNDCR